MSKEALALLLGVPKGQKDDSGGELKDFARDILDAIKDDDADALALALKGAVGCCDEPDEDDHEEEESK